MISDDLARLPVASTQPGDHPRPQLLRERWTDLSGAWGFAHDDADIGLAAGWPRHPSFDRTIQVPFPPESAASGVADTAHHRVLWYSRELTAADLSGTGFAEGDRLMLRFGAVDYRCRVWVDGQMVGEHEGGHTPFSFDVTDVLSDTATHTVVVRAEDDPEDVAQPRGKQDWREHPHVIWYHRTSGIWQPVWLEAVPAVAVTHLHWIADVRAASARVRIRLSRVPSEALPVEVVLRDGDVELGRTSTTTRRDELDVSVAIPALTNGQAYEELLWAPEHPRLIDAVVAVGGDAVSSYLGLRTAEVGAGRFLLNDLPFSVRSVLSQGYWPESHLAAPSADALRAEVQLIKDLGFTAARVHQKFEDPRFLHWADRLGLLVWGEAPATFAFTPTAVARSVREWLEVVDRDFSHPSIVTWVPLNESWGIPHVSRDERMRHYARSLVGLTKALDPTRPVVSNDGWEQVDTDIVAIHDYASDPEVLAARYRDRAAVDAMIAGVGPAGRRLVLTGDVADAPIMLTEFGGISFHVDAAEGSWGYSAARSAEDFDARLSGLLDAVHASGVLAGFCYTQLTDTLQETNGLVGADRVPKLPIERLREIITGTRAE
ncbi:glycoside hydrolase family 2 protein [Microbacterium lemovicicum]|nr:sugar-binding domain-containing protein [Microbacterium lemovicicum]